ncbi:hypothetical protein BOO86_01410 [Mycobacterium sp. CBMA 234]|uniref:LysM domain-containing protein n=1 Tax=Mycolicibacterium sp. CBMA 234 TaxID=1918495 RepID=UPI0012DCADA5|nr:LysM domain-containing protein [Mycolicibacterium sp. CBMA 234]MUL63107.1 hypothetical protein [Mycolicibacterium sp. CBMA 234]
MTTDPSSLLAQLLRAGAITSQSFGPESRYYGLPLQSLTTSAGAQIRYVSRRFIPPPTDYAVLQLYRVKQGDRVDVVAAAVLGNPLSYWQLCDANASTQPPDVVAIPGAFITVTLPAGVPGSSGATGS